jgi:hypothetical protein
MKRGIPFVLEKGGFSLKDEPAHGCMRGFTTDFRQHGVLSQENRASILKAE